MVDLSGQDALCWRPFCVGHLAGVSGVVYWGTGLAGRGVLGATCVMQLNVPHNAGGDEPNIYSTGLVAGTEAPWSRHLTAAGRPVP